MYLHKKGCSPAWYGPTTEKTVWELKKESRNEYHPTQKPVELPERALNNSSKYGDSILDLFGGSGSTLIACEKTNRNAYLMELDPKYVDVIINRWQDFTGKEATHIETGKTYKELKESRVIEEVE
jgi:DNA modification methylase